MGKAYLEESIKREERITQGVERIADALEGYINERIESDKVLFGLLREIKKGDHAKNSAPDLERE